MKCPYCHYELIRNINLARQYYEPSFECISNTHIFRYYSTDSPAQQFTLTVEHNLSIGKDNFGFYKVVNGSIYSIDEEIDLEEAANILKRHLKLIAFI